MRADPHGLLIPAKPSWRAAVAVFTPTGLVLRRSGVEVTEPWGGRPWRIAAMAASRSGDPIGLAVVDEVAATELAPTWSWLLRLPPFSTKRRTRVPIRSSFTIFGRSDETLRALSALAAMVAADPEVAAHLGDDARVGALAVALRRWREPERQHRAFEGRRRFEVHQALQRGGRFHRYRRPLPGWDRPPVETVIAEIRTSLSRNPYLTGIEIDDGLIEEVVRQEYLDVRPWPFEALVS